MFCYFITRCYLVCLLFQNWRILALHREFYGKFHEVRSYASWKIAFYSWTHLSLESTGDNKHCRSSHIRAWHNQSVPSLRTCADLFTSEESGNTYWTINRFTEVFNCFIDLHTIWNNTSHILVKQGFWKHREWPIFFSGGDPEHWPLLTCIWSRPFT